MQPVHDHSPLVDFAWSIRDSRYSLVAYQIDHDKHLQAIYAHYVKNPSIFLPPLLHDKDMPVNCYGILALILCSAIHRDWWPDLEPILGDLRSFDALLTCDPFPNAGLWQRLPTQTWTFHRGISRLPLPQLDWQQGDLIHCITSAVFEKPGQIVKRNFRAQHGLMLEFVNHKDIWQSIVFSHNGKFLLHCLPAQR